MRLKDVVILRNEKTTDTSKPYIALENIISWDAKYIESSIETEGTNSVFKPNDILFGKLRPYLAKGFIPSYEGICSTEFFVLKAKKGYYTQYLLYLLLSHSFIDYIKNQVAGVKMPRTNWETFSSIEVSIPSLEVQQRIVEYLEAKTTEIDKKIELLGKKRDAYNRLKTATINRAVTRGLDEHVKLKDSGVEWIGKIPEHWEVKRFKSIFTECKDVSTTGTEDLLSVSEYYGIARRTDKMEDGEYETRAESLVGYKLCQKGDLVINIMLAWKRGLGISDYNGIVSPSYAVYRGRRIIPHYFHYLMRTDKYIAEYKRNSTGIIDSRLRLYTDKFNDIKAIVPPLSEQKQIAAYLDDHCAKIDAAVTIIDKQIDALKRLKRSLINEVVTGKRTI